MAKSFKLFLSGLGLLLLAGGSVPAGVPADTNRPYGQIISRNLFGLEPLVAPAPATPSEPLPKITPNGIISIFGAVQVMFKVTESQPGQPDQEKSYLLGQGQSENAIEVTSIDDRNARITFKNHGTVQELTLITGTASSSFASAQEIAAAGGTAPGLSGSGMFGAGLQPDSPGLPGNRRISAAALRKRQAAQNRNASNPPDATTALPGSMADSGGAADAASSNGPVVSEEEHLLDLQMVAYARQRMQ
jgi:hypothetical protein